MCGCKGELFHLYFSELQLLSWVYWLYFHLGPVVSSEYAGSGTGVGVGSNNQGNNPFLCFRKDILANLSANLVL